MCVCVCVCVCVCIDHLYHVSQTMLGLSADSASLSVCHGICWRRQAGVFFIYKPYTHMHRTTACVYICIWT